MTPSSRLDLDALTHLLTWQQTGIVARRQILELGGTDNDIERMLRRRDLTTVHRGVYANHTGPLTRKQREWAAVLAYWPAALSGESALPDPRRRVITVAIDHSRRVRLVVPDVRVHRVVDLAERVNWLGAPPAVLVEHALLEVMSGHLRRGDVAAAFAELTRVTFTRLTNPDRIAAALEQHSRIAGRRTITGLLEDARTGAASVLERGYLLGVERAHGLPRGVRQHRRTVDGRAAYEDVRYPDLGIVVELDGRATHDNAAARDADAGRDLAALVESDAVTIRLTFGQVYREGCRTASRVGVIMQRRGWTGRPRRCAACPPLR